VKNLNKPPFSHLWILHEEGKNINDCKIEVLRTQNSFMLGDYRGFDSKTDELILENGLKRVSLGRISYLSSHCIALIISKFERMVK
jgi:tRNA pseudouridine-54 N-methylase